MFGLDFECKIHNLTLIILVQSAKVVQKRHLPSRRLFRLYSTNCSLNPPCSFVHVVALLFAYHVQLFCLHGRCVSKLTSHISSVFVIERGNVTIEYCFAVRSRQSCSS